MHNEQLHDLHASASIIRVIKTRMRGVGHVALVGAMRNAFRIFVRKPEGNSHLKVLGVDWRIILKCILRKGGGEVWA
jgi:hypothetical protein